ncbi:MAG: DUF3667 domain-containing protein [Pacificimonas sp.]
MADWQEQGGAIFGGGAARPLGGSPDTPARHAKHIGTHQAQCPNCGTQTPGNYCPQCGQHAHLKRSIGELLHELAHGVLHLDGKVWRTLPLLVFRPGKLTRDYIDGHRARYVPPFGVFLFSIFALYFTFAFFGPDGNFTEDADPVANVEASMTAAQLTRRIAELDADMQRLEAEIEALEDPSGIGALIAPMVQLQSTQAGFERALVEANALDAAAPEGTPPVKVDVEVSTATFGQELERAAEEGDFQFINGIDGLDWLNKPVVEMFEDPDYAIYRVKQSAYKFSFLLVPLSLPSLWLLFFWRRDVHFYDHMVFVLYSLSVFSLMMITLWLLGTLTRLGWGLLVLLFIIAHQMHMY